MHHILSVVASYLSQDRVRSHSLLNCRFLGEGGQTAGTSQHRRCKYHLWCTLDIRGNDTCGIPHQAWTLPVHRHGRCTRSNARLIQPWSCTPHQPPCGTSDKNTWCHKCLHHNMHTLPEQEEKDLGRGWHVRTTEVGQPMRLN